MLLVITSTVDSEHGFVHVLVIPLCVSTLVLGVSFLKACVTCKFCANFLSIEKLMIKLQSFTRCRDTVLADPE